jgi:hypothetical protein
LLKGALGPIAKLFDRQIDIGQQFTFVHFMDEIYPVEETGKVT